MEDGSEQKKPKEQKVYNKTWNYVLDYVKDSLLNNEVILKLQERLKSDHHNVYTEEVNKIALSNNDDKRLQTFNKITTYPYGTNAFEVRENETMIVRDYFVENYADCPFYNEIVLQQHTQIKN